MNSEHHAAELPELVEGKAKQRLKLKVLRAAYRVGCINRTNDRKIQEKLTNCGTIGQVWLCL
jgi:hypothetical protein